jgi:hypothetical protein
MVFASPHRQAKQAAVAGRIAALKAYATEITFELHPFRLTPMPPLQNAPSALMADCPRD